jgi:lysophospholipase L1-like esterase
MFETYWSMSQRYLDYTLKAFREKGVNVLIVNLSNSLLFPGRDKARKIHALMLNTKVSNWAKENNLPFLSLFLTRKNCRTNNPYEIIIEDDGHLTAKGHWIIAQRLRPWLIQHLPAKSSL